MKSKLKSWQALLGIKVRALEHMQRSLTTQHSQLLRCQAELQQTQQALAHSQAQCTQHDRQLEARLLNGQSISVQLYLDYASYRQILLENIQEARLAKDKTAESVNTKQDEIEVTRQMIVKMKRQRDLITEKISALNQAATQIQDMDQDEESAETNLSRHLQISRAVAQEVIV